MQKEKESRFSLKVGQYYFVGTDPLFKNGWVTKVTDPNEPNKIGLDFGFRCQGILLHIRNSQGNLFYNTPTSILYRANGRYLRDATVSEIKWLNACIKANALVLKPFTYLRIFLNHKNWK